MPLDPRYVAKTNNERIASTQGDLSKGLHGVNRRGSAPSPEFFNLSDDSETVFSLVHHFGTRNVRIEVFQNDGDFQTLTPTVPHKRPQTNQVVIELDDAPGTYDPLTGLGGAIAIIS